MKKGDKTGEARPAASPWHSGLWATMLIFLAGLTILALVAVWMASPWDAPPEGDPREATGVPAEGGGLKVLAAQRVLSHSAASGLDARSSAMPASGLVFDVSSLGSEIPAPSLAVSLAGSETIVVQHESLRQGGLRLQTPGGGEASSIMPGRNVKLHVPLPSHLATEELDVTFYAGGQRVGGTRVAEMPTATTVRG